MGRPRGAARIGARLSSSRAHAPARRGQLQSPPNGGRVCSLQPEGARPRAGEHPAAQALDGTRARFCRECISDRDRRPRGSRGVCRQPTRRLDGSRRQRIVLVPRHRPPLSRLPREAVPALSRFARPLVWSDSRRGGAQGESWRPRKLGTREVVADGTLGTRISRVPASGLTPERPALRAGRRLGSDATERERSDGRNPP